ncbi:MAG: glucose 1-dehydrogenase [Planctomycetota bacterium]|nr:glucose 1-dehydrogenase [Planctomycetota bacterium]MDA1137465.1 glucose 1-dehydrogenase [Planctomycetota bacterium]
MEIRFKDQTILITGSASGIGKGIATEFAASGGNVVIADLNEAGAQTTADELAREHGVQTMAVRVDVTSKAECQAMAGKVMGRFGRIDCLVNNAGVTLSYPIEDFPEDKWDLTMAINLKGYFLITQAVVPRMKAGGRGGSIVNIASKTGLRGSAANSAYSASKGGVVIMTQGWAREFAPEGIRVNSVCPGNVLHGSGNWSDELKRSYAVKLGITVGEVEQHYINQVPLKRPCTVEDVANLVVFLSSDKASYITGCWHLVDGGQEMR